jgi:hypothetical protein
MSSWKGRWPLGRGFERFYGFLGGETNQWYPDLVYDNHAVDAPASADDDTADVPESVGVNIRRRSYTIAAGVTIDTPEAGGVLFAHGGVGGGHSLYVKDGRLHYVYNWLGERIQKVVADREITAEEHVFTAEFGKTGDEPNGSAIGTLTLYIDTEAVVTAEIVTQPGFFALVGDRICVGWDSGSPVSPDYPSPFPFTGGTINRVVVDVSGDHYVDHEKEVLAYLHRD